MKKAVEWRFLSPIDFCQPAPTALPTTKILPRALFFSPLLPPPPPSPPLKGRVYFATFAPPRGGNSPVDYRGPFYFFLPPFKKNSPFFFTTALAAILKRWSQRSGSRVSRPCVEQVTATVVKRTRVQPPETRNQTNRGPRSRRCSRPAGSRRSTDGQRHAAGFGAARAPKTVATRAAHGRDLTSSLPSPTEREEELG